MSVEEDNVSRKLSVINHRKKQAANDAQLLMNRIALLQKEEERARKKIDQTKERATEIISMRDENERRMRAYIEASSEEKALQRELQERNKEMEIETKRALAMQSQRILHKRKEDAHVLNQEKRNLTRQLIKEQENELRMKQQRREEVRRMEEEARARREHEKREQDRRLREMLEAKAAAEEAEARRAEKLVKALEKKEREWMTKLQEAQSIQEAAFGHLEYALVRDGPASRSSRDGDSPRDFPPASGATASGASMASSKAAPKKKTSKSGSVSSAKSGR